LRPRQRGPQDGQSGDDAEGGRDDERVPDGPARSWSAVLGCVPANRLVSGRHGQEPGRA
jgi:hypothetical protein